MDAQNGMEAEHWLKDTKGGSGELQTTVISLALATDRLSTAFSHLPNFHLCYGYNFMETCMESVFYFLNFIQCFSRILVLSKAPFTSLKKFGHHEWARVLAPEVALGHRARARALAPEVVLGHRARALALVWTGFRQCLLYIHFLTSCWRNNFKFVADFSIVNTYS